MQQKLPTHALLEHKSQILTKVLPEEIVISNFNQDELSLR